MTTFRRALLDPQHAIDTVPLATTLRATFVTLSGTAMWALVADPATAHASVVGVLTPMVAAAPAWAAAQRLAGVQTQPTEFAAEFAVLLIRVGLILHLLLPVMWVVRGQHPHTEVWSAITHGALIAAWLCAAVPMPSRDKLGAPTWFAAIVAIGALIVQTQVRMSMGP
jgi:hypothetical protein